jgi:mRNA-degrading endonuclease YafQ of YafQ-DinJ toxin-antitoxin module
MQRIKGSSLFKRDYKKAMPRHGKDVGPLLADALTLLPADRHLPASNRDHPLAGEWNGTANATSRRISYSSTGSLTRNVALGPAWVAQGSVLSSPCAVASRGRSCANMARLRRITYKSTAAAIFVKKTWLTRNRGCSKLADSRGNLLESAGIRAFKIPVKYCGFTIISLDASIAYDALRPLASA